MQNAEIKIQNQEIIEQTKEIKDELNQEIKQEIKNEIKEQIEKSPEEVVVIELEKPKQNKEAINQEKKATIKKEKICPQCQHLCPECQKKTQQEIYANDQYEEYPYYEMYQSQYEAQPEYYQQIPYQEKCNYGSKTFKPRVFTNEEYQNLMKKAKPMFTVLNYGSTDVKK